MPHAMTKGLLSCIFQSLVDSSAQRLVNLASQWEKHRAPLIQEYRKLKEVSEDRLVSKTLAVALVKYETLYVI